MFGATTNPRQRKICACAKEVCMFSTIVERPIDHIELDPAVFPRLEELAGEPYEIMAGGADLFLQRTEQLTTAVVIDRPTIIRVYQAEVPEFSALVEVRHAWNRQLEKSLRQRIVNTKLRNLILQRLKAVEEQCPINYRADKFFYRVIVSLVRVNPTRVDLRFFSGLTHIRLNPLLKYGRFIRFQRSERPGTEKGLIQEIFLVAIRYRLALYMRFLFPVNSAPAAEGYPPFVRNLGQHIDPRTDIFAPLGIVCCRGQERVRPSLKAFTIVLVKRGKRGTELFRSPSYFVERDEPVVEVKGGIFHPLRHDGPGVLLKLLDKRALGFMIGFAGRVWVSQ